MLNYLLGFLWIVSYSLLVIISAIKLRLPSSLYQLKFNSQKGNKDANKWLWYWENRSVIKAMLKLKKGFLSVVFVSITTLIFGFWLGMGIAILMMLLLVRLDNLQMIHQMANKIFWSMQPKFVSSTKLIARYFFKLHLAKRDEDKHLPRISSVDELREILKFNSSNLPKIEYTQLTNLLDVQDTKLKHVMLPKNRIAFIDSKEMLTPKLVDDLHKSHNGFAFVFDGDIKNLVGILSLGGPDLLEEIKSPTRVSEKMQKGLCYLPEHATLSTFVASSIETRQNIFAIVDGKSNITGAVSSSLMFEWQYNLDLPSHEADSITWDNPEAMARYELLQKKD